MFPRAAIAIVVLLITGIAAIMVRGSFVADRGECVRNVAIPYQQLMDRMRRLSDEGRTAELRQLIIQAQEHTKDVADVCWEPHKEVYAIEVHKWIK
jgi:hypothetical protein